MSIYRFPKSQILGDITFRTTENGSVRAYIAAQENADRSETARALQDMRDKGYTCTPFMFDGKPMLEVRGFGKEAKLLETLKPWTGSEPEIELEDADKLSWMDRFRKRSLQLSGVTYIVGDIGFLNYGLREGDRLVMAGAVSYFLGTLSLIFYGRNDQSDLQIRDLSKQLEAFLCQQGVALPKDSVLHSVVDEKNKTWLQSANEFGQRYPSEIFNIVTAIAGTFVAASAYKNKILVKPTATMDAHAVREMQQEGWMDLGLGTLTGLSGIFATLVKEKKPDPDEPPAKGLNKVWQFIRAHPLAIAGGGYSIATGFHTLSTYKAYKEAKRVNDQKRLGSVPMRALFVLMAFTSEFLLAISSKGHGEGVVSDNSVDQTAIAIAADFIARQPEGQQQKIIDATAEFLGSEKRLAMKNEEIAANLRQQVGAIRRNPWMDVSQKKAEVAAPVASTAVASQEHEKAATAAWQAKLAASQPPAPQLGA